jgi:hypothetical protein
MLDVVLLDLFAPVVVEVMNLASYFPAVFQIKSFVYF